MQIWPAIDLRGGKCVRLQQGDYGRETIFGDDPAAQARLFVEQGAEHLHLVDLDGAKSGRVENWDAIEAIVTSVSAECELGGGVRDEATICRLLETGVRRVIIGTLALKQPDWFRGMCRKYPSRLVLGIDARNGMVATEGWLETSRTDAVELARGFAGEPIAALIYTDIDTDGMLAGPNFQALEHVARNVEMPVVASGGITTLDDIVRLGTLPIAGAIVGRALYEGSLNLGDALAKASGENTY